MPRCSCDAVKRTTAPRCKALRLVCPRPDRPERILVSMRAVVCSELGEAAAITVQEMPSPAMGDAQVRIGVKAAGVDFPDIPMIQGKYQVKLQLPFIPGLEVAGEVLECGAGARRDHVAPGRRQDGAESMNGSAGRERER